MENENYNLANKMESSIKDIKSGLNTLGSWELTIIFMIGVKA